MEKRRKLEGLKDFMVGLRVAILFLISVVVGAGILLVCGIGFAIATPIFIIIGQEDPLRKVGDELPYFRYLQQHI